MDKHAVRMEIGRILDDQCHVCPYGGAKNRSGNQTGKSSLLVPECNACPHYTRIRQLAKSLGNLHKWSYEPDIEIKLNPKEELSMPVKALMSVTDCAAYINHGLSNAEIAKEIGATEKQVDNFLQNHKLKIEKLVNKQPKTSEKAVKTAENEQKANKAFVDEDQYKAVVAERDRLKHQNETLQEDRHDRLKTFDEKQKEIDQLKDQSKQLSENYEEINHKLSIANKYRQTLLKTIGEKQKLIDKIDTDYGELTETYDNLEKQLSDAQTDIDCLKQSAAHHHQLYQSAKNDELRQNKLVVAAEAYIVALLSQSE